METTLIIALITGFVSFLGWIINHNLTRLRDQRNQRDNNSLKYIERQLEELYGPLAILMHEGRRTFYDLLDKLGRNYVFSENGEDLPQEELKLWLFWINNDLMPRNEKIREILISKTHLIEGESIPKSYILFLDYYNSWKINHLRWEKENIKYNWHSKTSWPKEFSEEILRTFSKIKEKQSKYLEHNGKF